MQGKQCKTKYTFNPCSPYEAAIYNNSWLGEKKKNKLGNQVIFRIKGGLLTTNKSSFHQSFHLSLKIEGSALKRNTAFHHSLKIMFVCLFTGLFSRAEINA